MNSYVEKGKQSFHNSGVVYREPEMTHYDSLGQSIKRARKAAGLTQRELAERVGVTRPAVGQWESDATSPGYAMLDAVAKELNTTAQKILFGGDQVSEEAAHYPVGNVRPGPTSARYVPEISWVQAGVWTEVDELSLDLSEATHWPCPVACSDRTFALRVEGDSMAPYFLQGSLIFVDPEVMPISGKKVVALLTDSNQATFKQFIEDGGQKMLKAMNPNWPQQYIPINGNCRIVGTVVFAGMET